MRWSRTQAGFSKLEFAVVCTVISALTYFFLDAVYQVEVSAEKAMVDVTIRNIRMGLKLAVAEKRMQGREAELAQILEQDPVTRVYPGLRSYAGQRAESDFNWLAAGEWGFDPGRKILVYRPRMPDRLEIDGGADVLRWAIVSRGVPSADSGPVRLEGFDVVPVANYRWRP